MRSEVSDTQGAIMIDDFDDNEAQDGIIHPSLGQYILEPSGPQFTDLGFYNLPNVPLPGEPTPAEAVDLTPPTITGDEQFFGVGNRGEGQSAMHAAPYHYRPPSGSHNSGYARIIPHRIGNLAGPEVQNAPPPQFGPREYTMDNGRIVGQRDLLSPENQQAMFNAQRQRERQFMLNEAARRGDFRPFLQEREWNFQDQQRKTRLEAQQASIDNDPNLTPQDKARLRAMTDPELSKLQFRKVIDEQKKIKQQDDMRKMSVVQMGDDGKFLTNITPENHITIDHGGGHKTVIFYAPGKNGMIEPHYREIKPEQDHGFEQWNKSIDTIIKQHRIDNDLRDGNYVPLTPQQADEILNSRRQAFEQRKQPAPVINPADMESFKRDAQRLSDMTTAPTPPPGQSAVLGPTTPKQDKPFYSPEMTALHERAWKAQDGEVLKAIMIVQNAANNWGQNVPAEHRKEVEEAVKIVKRFKESR